MRNKLVYFSYLMCFMRQQIIKNLNKLIEEVYFLMLLYSSLCIIRVLTVREHKDYDINP
jgi:hypothetical protein